jgi:hypothetical protein
MGAFAFVAQLISTISVIVSLVYPALKIRQDTGLCDAQQRVTLTRSKRTWPLFHRTARSR